MTPSQAGALLEIAFGIFALTLFWRYCWVPQCVDNFREELFQVRHQLFMMTRRGELPADSETYRFLRGLSNSLLRFGDRVTLLGFVLALVYVKVPPPDIIAEVRREELQPETRQEVEALQLRIWRQIGVLMVSRSWIAWLFFTIVTAISVFKREQIDAIVGRTISGEAARSGA